MLNSKNTLSYDFIILANSHWNSGGGGNSAQQYARALAKRGYNYTFIGPTEVSKACEIIKRQESYEKTIVFCNLPLRDYFDICKILKNKGSRIIYRIVDGWAHILKNEWYDIKWEIEIIKLADLCYATSQGLLDKFKEIRHDIKLLPNAVAKEQFAKTPSRRPNDLKSGRITIGFWGSFWYTCFDWDLVKNLAGKRPDWVINLVGGNPEEIRDKINGIPDNIVLIGQKRWEDLYKYLYYFDVCIIPYIRTDGTIEADPIKALEYLAGYKPVVSYYNQSLIRIPYTYFYEGGTDFEKKIISARKQKINRKAIDSFLKKNTWEYRLEQIIRDLTDIGRRKASYDSRLIRNKEFALLTA